MKFLFRLDSAIRLFFLILLCLSLNACRKTPAQITEIADDLALENGFEKNLVDANHFILATYQKIKNKNGRYIFYIEGDGLAFTRYGVSSNPTPTTNHFLDLALMDNHDNVVYIARPCQHIDLKLVAPCSDKKYWSTDRFSQESVDIIYAAIRNILGENKKKFDLVGFSGGGAIASLITAQHRDEVNCLITIAANLDIVAFNRYHNVLQMPNSLNPIDFSHNIKNVRQLHLCGNKDNRVPCFIAKSFIEKLNSKQAEYVIIEGASHNHGWVKIWNNLLKWMNSNAKYQPEPSSL